MNIATNLERAARFFPDNVAAIQGQDQMTYAQWNERSGRLASGLSALGLGAGDKVAMCAPNSLEWLVFYFALHKLGAVAITLSSLLRPSEFRALMSHAKPKALFCDAGRVAEGQDLRAETGMAWIIAPGGDMTADDLAAKAQEPLAAVERDRDEVACVLYTGGTTGLAKGVMLSHECINTNVRTVPMLERATPADRSLCFLPFNHVFGQMHIMNATVYCGGGLVLMPGFELEAALEAIDKHKITKFYAVPTIYLRLLQVPDLAQKVANLRYSFCAAASMPLELMQRWKEATGLDIHEAYGLTETTALVTYNHYLQHKHGSVGEPVGTVEVSIRDPLGMPLPRGQEGEICVRGRNVMLGYLDNQEATRKTFHGQWLRTGDVGYLDPEGYLFIVDRLKDVIITGGENVYPREVEEVLYQRPEVGECSVVGVPDAEFGERVVAVIVPKDGFDVDGAELKAYLKEKLSGFKVPKEFIIQEELPKSAVGKVLKRKIRDNLVEEQGEARA